MAAVPSPASPLVTFDLDGVLARPPFGINPGENRHKDRAKPGSRNLLWMTESFRYFGRRPMPGAREGVAAVSEIARVAVVTARAGVAEGHVRRWLRHNIGVVPDLYLRPHWRETSAAYKARLVPSLGAVAHVEDDPHTARWLAELIPLVVLIDWPRNRWLEGDNILRVGRIEDALPRLREFVASRP